MSLYDRRRYDYFRRMEKSQSMRYLDLVIRHTFEIVDAGKNPDGMRSKCAFCGQYIKYYIAIKRDDGIKVKVGQFCLERAGLKLTKECKDKMDLPKKKKKPKTHDVQKNTKEDGEEETSSIEDDLLKMLDDI